MEPMKHDGTGQTCVLRGGDCANVRHCRLDNRVCWSADPCHCPALRAAALAAQMDEGMVAVPRKVAKQLEELARSIWLLTCAEDTSALLDGWGSLILPGIRRLVDAGWDRIPQLSENDLDARRQESK